LSVFITFDKRNSAWLASILIGVLGCYASTLHEMAHQSLTDDDMGHGLVVCCAAHLIVGCVERTRQMRRTESDTEQLGLRNSPSGRGMPI